MKLYYRFLFSFKKYKKNFGLDLTNLGTTAENYRNSKNLRYIQLISDIFEKTFNYLKEFIQSIELF